MVKEVWGELVTEEPMMQRFGPLSVILLLYLLLNFSLWIVTFLDTAYEQIKFKWALFGQVYRGLSTAIMLLLWIIYGLWTDACKTLPFKGQQRQRSRGYVIGMNMHSCIQRCLILLTVLFNASLFLFTYILAMTEEFKGHLEHSVAVRLLSTLSTIGWVNMILCGYAIAVLLFPTSAIQNVMVFVPVNKMSNQ